MADISTEAPLGYLGGEVRRLDAAAVEAAVSGAVSAARAVKALSSFDRAAILDAVVEDLRARKAELARAMAAESGYLTLRDMMLEVDRTIDVFTLCAAAART